MTHRRAVCLMLLVTLMWSIAGVASRHFQAAQGFEVTFWRSAFNALALVLLLGLMRGPLGLWRSVADGGRALWLSSVCWCVMFTAFMLAITMTTVANVLVTMALGPLFTALGSRFVLRHQLPQRTWAAIVLAGIGIAWMYGGGVVGGEPRHFYGTLIALGVPVAAAVNWILLQHLQQRDGLRARAQQGPSGRDTTEGASTTPEHTDMLPAVLIGALMSAALTLPMALPFAATPRDLSLLALLGVVQLAIPCLLAVRLARVMKAPEMSLLSLLEVVLGVLWAWLGAGEAPTAAVLGGGLLVLVALAGNEALAMRRR